MLGKNASKSVWTKLNGETVPAESWVFFPQKDVVKVDWYIDYQLTNTDNQAPFDLEAGGKPLRKLSDGNHTVVAHVYLANKTDLWKGAGFVVKATAAATTPPLRHR